MNNKTRILGEMSIGKLLFKMSVPATIGMLVMALYNVVDAIFIGHFIGSVGLAAVSIVFPIMMIIIALSVGFGIGASSLISLEFGKKNIENANHIFNNFLFSITSISIIISIIFYFFIDEILIFLGSNTQIFPFAKEYFLIIIFGIFFQMFSASVNNIIRTEGAAKTAMITMIIGAVLNIILDYVFLVILNYGISGIALSTIIAQFFQFLFTLYYFVFSQSILKIKINYFLPKIIIIKQILSLGFPSFVRQSSMSIVGIIMNNLLKNYGGVLEIAAYGIIFRVLMMIIMPAMGIVQGVQPIIGFNYGAKKYIRVKETLKLSIKISSSIMLFTYLLVMIYPEIFIKIFSTDPKLIETTSSFIRIMFLLIPFIGFQFIAGGFFQSIGKAKPALIISLFRQIIMLIPLLIILPLIFGIMGIWYAYPISDFISLILTYYLFNKEYNKL